ncbi:hypothetical protein PFICI_01787 [Pestalotiopsis fici W106-1]|uniref:RRM domain-containing protein n=1 Tax=Pestalotiopsis fici (strain W106-1 / CGMCC3.15140) TaxID=1229662 RepID=W3XPQ1_PESFW|nr:uncharacterized protein PFICI_01787 [Pestalotiopsis fici W106-1]ETS87959.1 hypothetical protein PFICI_01787 [Pestalotiopsis fici W106-1]
MWFSVRRAALRAASSSSSLAAATLRQQQHGSFALQFAKFAARPAIVAPARLFSQTSRVAQEDEDEKNTVEGAIKAAETLGSTAPATETPVVAENESTGIYIGNLSWDATEENLREAFAKYGEIVQLNIAKDARGLSRGFAFVTYTDKAAAEAAVAETAESFWHGRRINVQVRNPALRREGRRDGGRDGRMPKNEPSTSLYIGNIPYETSDVDLNRLFRELEGVTDVRVAVDRTTGWPRGFAHADFVDVESAQKALEKLAQTELAGRTLRPDFAGGRTNRGFSDRGDRRSNNRDGFAPQRDARDSDEF